MAGQKIIFEHASVAKMATPDARLPARPQNRKIIATPQHKKKTIERAVRTPLRSKSGTCAH
jgi:hypothetical protein